MINQIQNALEIGGRHFLVVGTAHVGQASVEVVRQAIESWGPDHVCVELDSARLESLRNPDRWQQLDVYRVLRQGRGLWLLASVVLAAFQRRIGSSLGTLPGQEMLAAVTEAEARGLSVSLIDRPVDVTLRRVWQKTGFWGRNRLLALMFALAFDRNSLKEDDVERLRQGLDMDVLMDQLAKELPSVKKVLIDERDLLLAWGAWNSPGKRVLVVIGAGHVPGVLRALKATGEGHTAEDAQEMLSVPPPGLGERLLPWLIPALLVGLLANALWSRGGEGLWALLRNWGLMTATGAAVGGLVALAHPLTLLTAFVVAPITALHPLLGVGMFTGLVELWARKPRVLDFQNLLDDAASLRGFYRNRITRALLVMLFTSLGVIVGTFLAGTTWFSLLWG